MIDKAFAQVIRELRLSLALSQEALAHEVGIHRTYVSQLERGLKSPSLKTIFKISKALNVSIAEMMRLTEMQLAEDS